MFGVMQHLNITMCENAEDAIAQGFNYNAPEFKAIEIERVVVVKNGTELGNPTVDLILCDQNGNKFVVMVTARLLKSIPLGPFNQ